MNNLNRCDALERHPQIQSWEEANPLVRTALRAEVTAWYICHETGVRLTPGQVQACISQDQAVYYDDWNYLLHGFDDRAVALTELVNSNNTLGTIQPVTLEQVRAFLSVDNKPQLYLNGYKK